MSYIMNILLGVSGSIALYRSLELARLFVKKNHNVMVAMTPTAASWVTPLMFSAITNNTVYTGPEQQEMAHIYLREKLDVFIIAPATANIIAKAASGIADNIVTTTLLAYHGPRWIAPAMNPFMYSHPIVQRNIQTLKEVDYHIFQPDSGEAICGDIGEGKMAPIEDMMLYLEELEKIKSLGSENR